MPAWPEKRTWIGSRATRVDGPAKVTGAAKYTSDVQPEGWLYGMILRSKWPKARITTINLEKALKVPGIKAAVLSREGERTARYYGEELAAVAGTSKQACLDALKAIEVRATPLPFVVREEDAREESAPRVWEEAPNLSKPSVNEKGEVDKAFGECAAVVEGLAGRGLRLAPIFRFDQPAPGPMDTVLRDAIEDPHLTVAALHQVIARRAALMRPAPQANIALPGDVRRVERARFLGADGVVPQLPG